MLCASCYTIIRRSDIESLDDYPKVSRDSEVLVSEAEFLARQHPGWTRRQLAARLGTTYANLWAAESRARKRAAA